MSNLKSKGEFYKYARTYCWFLIKNNEAHIEAFINYVIRKRMRKGSRVISFVRPMLNYAVKLRKTR